MVDRISEAIIFFLCGLHNHIYNKSNITKLRLNSVSYPTPSDKGGARLQSKLATQLLLEQFTGRIATVNTQFVGVYWVFSVNSGLSQKGGVALLS